MEQTEDEETESRANDETFAPICPATDASREAAETIRASSSTTTTTTTTAAPTFARIRLTTNALGDAIEMVRAGDVLVLHAPSRRARVFVAPTREHTETAWPDDDAAAKTLSRRRVAYIELATTPGLLDDDAWPWRIMNGGVDDCVEPEVDDALRVRVLTNATETPHRAMMRL